MKILILYLKTSPSPEPAIGVFFFYTRGLGISRRRGERGEVGEKKNSQGFLLFVSGIFSLICTPDL